MRLGDVKKRGLPERWYPLNFHPEQSRLWQSDARFCVAPPGRRSGKTELLKRKLVSSAMATSRPDAWFIAAAPTRDQAKRIFWRDLKSLSPGWAIKKLSESELSITYINDAELQVVGMDKPERAEGRALDGAGLDEYGNMREDTWAQHVRPALSTPGRLGWAWFIGVPEGRNHYWRLAEKAKKPEMADWDYFHWVSADILDPEEIEAAKADLDPLTFAQEYEGSFLNFEGRAYWAFDRDIHARWDLPYDDTAPLLLGFDFNVEPGICIAMQELKYKGDEREYADWLLGAIDEIWIEHNSNTLHVCQRILDKWGDHKGDILVYGDATGGARGTSAVAGTDWDIVRQVLKPHFSARLKFRVPRQNPREKVRVNAMNASFRTADGKIHHVVDRYKCPHYLEDLEGVPFIPGGTGEINKRYDSRLTHMSDGAGYIVVRVKPLASQRLEVEMVA